MTGRDLAVLVFGYAERHPIVSLLYALLVSIVIISVVNSLTEAFASMFRRRNFESSGGSKSPAWSEARKSITGAFEGTRYDWMWVAEDDRYAVLMIHRLDDEETKKKEEKADGND